MPTPTQNHVGRGIVLMILAILQFSLMDALAKGLITRYPVPQVIWARYLGQLVIVSLFLGRRLGPSLRTRYPVLHMWRSALQFGATSFFFFSIQHIGLAEATALADINPVLVMLGAALFLGEPLGIRRLGAVLTALAGALVIIRPGMGVFSPAAVLPLFCAFSFAGNALLTRRIGPHESPWAALIYAALFGTVVSGLALPFVWQPIAVQDLGLFAIVGLLGSLAQFALIRAFSVAEAGIIAPFTYLGIVFATIWGLIFFDEHPDLPALLGALVIVGSGLYVWHHEHRATRRIANAAS